MKKNKPLLSLCLPTNGATQWVLPTLDSIYNQGVDLDLFEVVITDNGDNSDLEKHLVKYGFNNLRYYKSKDKGFLNLVTCLKLGNGLYNKMLNHRMRLKQDMLLEMIDVVKKYQKSKPTLYFLNGTRKLPQFVECKDLDAFIQTMTYWISWSAGIGFWDTDLDNLSNVKLNEMYPNTSLLLEHRQKTSYVVYNGVYGEMQDDSGKGGFDLFHTLCVVLMDIVADQYKRRKISQHTYNIFKKDLYRFICSAYYEEVVNKSSHTYMIQNVMKSFTTYYSVTEYWYMVLKENLRKIAHKVLRR